MNRVARCMLVATALSLPLAGCGSMPDFDFDPADWIAGDIFSTKKPLPGERKPVFPQGVPGVARGVPSELVKGNQVDESAQETAVQVEQPQPKPKPKAKPKPQPKVVAKPAPRPQTGPTSVTVRRAEPPPQPTTQQPQWPDPPPMRQAPAVTQWPDPPAPR